MMHASRVTTLAGVVMLAFSGASLAGTFSQSPDPVDVVIGGSASTVQFLFAGDGQTDNAQLDIQLSNVADLTITANAPLVPGAACTVIGGNVLRIVPPDASATASTLPATATAYCSFNITAGAMAAQGLRTWTANLVECSALGNPVTPCTFTQTAGSGVNVTTAPPDVTLSYTPAPNATVTFPMGTALTVQNASIAVSAAGTIGSGTVTNCGITGAGAASFGAPPADITVAAGASSSLPLTCTLPNSGGAASATLTCTETDSDSQTGVARAWPLSCPQGTPVPGPGFGASPAPNPAPAAPILCNGQAGETVQRQIQITNNGNAGAGSELTFTCSGTGIANVISGGTTTAPGLAVGASQTVVVECAVPADGVTETGAVSCTTNAPGGPFAFNYSSTGSTFPPPVPRPAVVPASSAWSQIALIALLAGLGLAFVGFRRGQ